MHEMRAAGHAKVIERSRDRDKMSWYRLDLEPDRRSRL